MQIYGIDLAKEKFDVSFFDLTSKKVSLDEAARVASEELVYQKNSHASKEYRIEMAKAMVRRLVKEVAQ